MRRIQFFEQERQATPETPNEAAEEGQVFLAEKEAQNLAAFEAAEPKEKAMDK